MFIVDYGKVNNTHLEGKAAAMGCRQLDFEGDALAWGVGGCWAQILECESSEGAAGNSIKPALKDVATYA